VSGAPTVIKLGGSFAFSQELRDWIEAIVMHRGRVVIVPGGGPFADAVREAQERMRFDDGTAHRMAVLAMEQYGCALAGMSGRLQLADSPEAIRRVLADGKVPVWLPAQMVLSDPDIPPSWDVTSDSLAAWLAGRIGAERLVLVKHVEMREKTLPASDLAARGVVDKAFAAFLAACGVPAFILGSGDHGVFCEDALGELAGIRIVA